jgi:uncharacterized protein (TIGR03000 family)
MSNRWIPAVFASLVLGALPSVSQAQYSGPGNRYGNAYSPYWYARHGSYYEPSYYGTSPTYYGSNMAGTATAVYGDAYSPWWYLKHGSYAEPHYYSQYSTPTVYGYPQPAYPPAFAAAPRISSASEEQEEAVTAANLAAIEVRVPANADLWFEGDKTSQGGAVRNFVSPQLTPGKTFTYDVRARWADSSGKVVDKTKQLKVQAGQRSTVDFSIADNASKK